MPNDYASVQYKEYLRRLKEALAELPPFCEEFFRGIESTTLIRTRYAYAVDLRLFFKYLVGELDSFQEYSVKALTLAALDRVTATEIEMFLGHISLYTNEENAEVLNHERAKARKLSALRSMYKYFLKKEKITHNSPALVDIPVIREKSIVRLEPDEVANLLDAVQSGEGLSETQKKYHKLTQSRDLAILTLFLGTGIRISELVGIDMDDINFNANEFSIVRKGGKQDILVFGDEARAALLTYMLKRERLSAAEGHENALFLSLQNKRLTVRAIENLVKKYASVATPLKKISPHKLRSTYGTSLYRETGDIYLVADVLGHRDVNTTRKHYAAISEDRRRLAAKVVKLREDAPKPKNGAKSEEKPED
ncbi:MAG: tyrosine-type recombinase/integrase [Clostridiaceae bacterium]|nr:tyrosine-type recombinase/integrase [Eubacteriales bacterium]